jgi:hypothetical protein
VQLALLTRYYRGFGRPVEPARQEHVPRHDDEFAGRPMIALQVPTWRAVRA